MLITYIDESGCTGALPSANAPIQPVFSLLALTLDADKLPQLTRDFTKLKKQFFPQASSSERPLDAGTFDGTAVYTSATQSLCQTFEQLLIRQNEHGIIIADSRNYAQNKVVAHSIFTEKFRHAGDKYPSIREMPLFGHSDNHAGIQLCDLVNSAILTPIACFAYCLGVVDNVHVDSKYELLRDKLGPQLKDLQFRYQDGNDRWKGGLTVADAIGKKSGALLFPK